MKHRENQALCHDALADTTAPIGRLRQKLLKIAFEVSFQFWFLDQLYGAMPLRQICERDFVNMEEVLHHHTSRQSRTHQ